MVMAAERYWVDENWTHHYARVHRATCSNCNDGRGTQSADSGQNIRWHGPYNDRDAAYRELSDFNPGMRAAARCAVP
jgi:hypothetical protein